MAWADPAFCGVLNLVASLCFGQDWNVAANSRDPQGTGANSDVHELERPLWPHSSGLPRTVSL